MYEVSAYDRHVDHSFECVVASGEWLCACICMSMWQSGNCICVCTHIRQHGYIYFRLGFSYFLSFFYIRESVFHVNSYEKLDFGQENMFWGWYAGVMSQNRVSRKILHKRQSLYKLRWIICGKCRFLGIFRTNLINVWPKTQWNQRENTF